MPASPDTPLPIVGTPVPIAPAAPQAASTHGNAGHGAASLIPHLQRRQAEAAAASPRHEDLDAHWSVRGDLPRP